MPSPTSAACFPSPATRVFVWCIAWYTVVTTIRLERQRKALRDRTPHHLHGPGELGSLPSAGTRAGTVRLGVDPHARSMIDHTLSVLATITTTDNILSMWSGDASRDAGSPL